MSETNAQISTNKNCPFCAETILAAAIVCRYCGRDLPITTLQEGATVRRTSSPAQTVAAPTKLETEQSEVTYLQNSDVTVTSARVLLGGKTYVLSNVTSVSLVVVPASSAFAIVVGSMGVVFGLVALGIGALLSFDDGKVFGIVVIIASIAFAVYEANKQKTKYSVKIGSSSGEANALWAYDKTYIEEIVTAINSAIVERG